MLLIFSKADRVSLPTISFQLKKPLKIENSLKKPYVVRKLFISDLSTAFIFWTKRPLF